MEAPSVLKNKAPGAWFLYMSGTLSGEDIKNAKELFCMEENILTATEGCITFVSFTTELLGRRLTKLKGNTAMYNSKVMVDF